MLTIYASYIMFFFSSRRRHTRYWRDWSSDVCSSDLEPLAVAYVPDPKAKGLDVLVRGWVAAGVEGARLEVYGLDRDRAEAHLRRTGTEGSASVEIRGTVPA